MAFNQIIPLFYNMIDDLYFAGHYQLGYENLGFFPQNQKVTLLIYRVLRKERKKVIANKL